MKGSFQGYELHYKRQGCGGEEVAVKRRTFQQRDSSLSRVKRVEG